MIDVLILAGDRSDYLHIENKNKAFLFIDGKPIIQHIIEQLDKTTNVKNIYIVGNPHAFSPFISTLNLRKRIVLFDQRDSIVENILFAYDNVYANNENVPILIIPADIPLISSMEIDSFIANSDYDKFDYIMGFADESILRKFCPSGVQTGIKFSYFYFKQFVGRQNNLHIVKPRNIINQEYIDVIYSLRYQKKIVNYLKFLIALLRSKVNKLPIIKLSLLLQLALVCDINGKYKLAHSIGKLIDVREFEKSISDALHIKFKILCVDFGASALDIDNEIDFVTINKMFHKWRDIADNTAREKT